MRETKKLEFKRDLSNSFLKTVSAFANYGSGRILFGVDDAGNKLGLDDPASVALAIENKINDAISPVPEYSIDIDSRTGVIELTVYAGLRKPYLYHSKAYRRSDTSTVAVDQLELKRLVLEGENLTYDAFPINDTDLAFTYLESWLGRAAGVSAVTPDVLRSLELLDADGAYNIAAKLLADNNDMPGIDAVRFGESISVLLDRETYAGCSILEQYDRAVELFRRYYVYEEVAGFERVERQRIPENAFREAIANALVHRQWDVTSHVTVSMFDDRVEVVSLGGLPSGLSLHDYLEGQVSVLRNPILGNVFFRLHIIERFGTGTLRIRDAYRGFARQPRFTVSDSSIRVMLPVALQTPGLSADEEVVWHVLEGRTMAISDIAEAVGFSKTKLKGILKRMAQVGVIEVVGSGRGTRYRAR